MKLNSSHSDLYKIYRIPKIRNGRRVGYRVIEEPEPALKEIQRRFLQKFHKEIKLHHAAHGVVGKSAVDNAKVHIGQKIIIKIDLSDFFPNTQDWMIIRGYESVKKIFPGSGHIQVKNFEADLKYCTLYDGDFPRLPQGAPTSPFLSNVAFHPYDIQVQMLANTYGLKYTRYVDDLTFSGDYRPAGFIARIGDIVAPYRINVRKIDSLHTAYQSQEVTGVVVNVKNSVPKGRRKLLRSKLDHLARERKEIDQKTRGELSYVYSVSPEQWATLMRHYEKRKEFYDSKTSPGSAGSN